MNARNKIVISRLIMAILSVFYKAKLSK
jgi:hypothetical protein